VMMDPEIPHAGRGLVAGVCLYNTDGQYMLCEHLSTNPKALAVYRHQAVNLLCHAARVLGAVMNKTLVSIVEIKGIARMMRKHGFEPGRLTFASERAARGLPPATRFGTTLYAAPEYPTSRLRMKHPVKETP
jgi:hypothetical protein